MQQQLQKWPDLSSSYSENAYLLELQLRKQQALNQSDPFLFDRQGKLDESILAILLIISKAVALPMGTTFPRVGVVSTESPSWALALMTTSAAMSNIAMTKLMNILSFIISTFMCYKQKT
jgi:hypothetical protein